MPHSSGGSARRADSPCSSHKCRRTSSFRYLFNARAPGTGNGSWDFTTFLYALLSVVNANLLMAAWVLRLSQQDRSTLMSDWATIRLHTRFMFQAKLSFWQPLPWILFGLAHHTSRKAIACGRRALALARNRNLVRRRQHYLVQLLCFPTGALCEQMRVFCDGMQLMSDFSRAGSCCRHFQIYSDCGKMDRKPACAFEKGLSPYTQCR